MADFDIIKVWFLSPFFSSKKEKIIEWLKTHETFLKPWSWMTKLINLPVIEYRLLLILFVMSLAALTCCSFRSLVVFLLRTLGQHGGVHVHDPQGHARRSFLPSRACPASGPLLIGPAGELWCRWECAALDPPTTPKSPPSSSAPARCTLINAYF